MSCVTPYHTISYHNMPYHTIAYHTISNHIMYHVISTNHLSTPPLLYVCEHKYRGQWRVLGNCPLHLSLPYFFRASLLSRLVVNKIQWSSGPNSSGVPGDLDSIPSLLCWCWNLNSGPHGCATRALQHWVIPRALCRWAYVSQWLR